MNESTFEARINAEITKHFSTINRLDITHQKVFTIKFGHSELLVGNNNKYNKYGILDVLISYRNIPLAILELKKPGVKLTDSDRDQGISYARLLDRIAPIVILSNGTDVKIYNTIEKSELEYESINNAAIKELFEHVSKCASSNEDEAIRLLLGQDYNLWRSLLIDFTKYQFDMIKGSNTDFRWPIVDGFSIKRSITNDIIKLLNQQRQKILLIGDSLSGKTNVIHQICNSAELEDSFVPIYIDCLSVNSGVFETIANYLSRKFYYEISTTDIKRWMNFGVSDKDSPKLLLVIDGLPYSGNDNINRDIQELTEISKLNNNIYIIISFDQGTYEELIKIPGRGYTKPIFRDYEQVSLNKLSNNEFKNTLDYLKSNHCIDFYNGANFNVDFRNPRILRILFARLDRAKLDVPNKNCYKEKVIYIYPSLTTGQLLHDVWECVVGDLQLKIDLLEYAKAYIKDKKEQDKDPVLKMFSFRDGSITHKTIQKEMNGSTVLRLVSQGIIRLINGPNNLILYQPIVPELISAAAARYIGEKCYEIYKCERIKKAVDFLIEESEPLPYGDIVGENALFLMIEKDNDIFVEIFNEMLMREPYILTSNVTGKFTVKEINNHVEIKNVENEQMLFIKNLHPYLILSVFACNNFDLKKGKDHPLLSLISIIGSTKIVLRRYSSPESNNMLGLHYHKISDNEWAICDKVGIIEPITLAMVLGLWREPAIMIRVAEMMEEDNNYYLAIRLHLAASYLINNILFEKSKKAAEIIIQLTKKVLYKNLEHITVNKIINCEVTRNQLCPCGSKMKYKKCCGK